MEWLNDIGTIIDDHVFPGMYSAHGLVGHPEEGVSERWARLRSDLALDIIRILPQLDRARMEMGVESHFSNEKGARSSHLSNETHRPAHRS
jgi:hypothetical protein